MAVRTVLQKVEADSSLSEPAEIARAIVQECNSFLLMGRPEAALAACDEVVTSVRCQSTRLAFGCR